MTVYFQGSELEALHINPGAGSYQESSDSSGTSYNPTYSRGSARGNGGGRITADAGQELTVFWAHVEWYQNITVSAYGSMLRVTDGNGNGAVRIRTINSSQGQAEYYNGGWIPFGGVIDLYDRSRRWDVRVEKGAGGSPDLIEIYWMEMLVADVSGVGLLAGFTGFQKVEFDQANTSVYVLRLSQVAIADEPMLDWRVLTIAPTADGTDTDGLGSVSDVNELNTNNGTFIAFDDPGERRSFVSTTTRTLQNEIKALTVACRARISSEIAEPNQIRPYVIPAGESTRYYGDTMTLTLGYLNHQYTWNQNPATSEDWTPMEINDPDLEYGWEIV